MDGIQEIYLDDLFHPRRRWDNDWLPALDSIALYGIRCSEKLKDTDAHYGSDWHRKVH